MRAASSSLVAWTVSWMRCALRSGVLTACATILKLIIVSFLDL
jgi:hypothetical protein